MQKRSFYLSLILLVVCFACGSKTSNSTNNDNITSIDTMLSASNEQIDYNCIDENKIFNDTICFLTYSDVGTRDTLREILELWKFKLDDDCTITLTLYKDSTYMYDSPCEWDFSFYGVFFYCQNALYCVELGLKHEYAPNPKSNPIMVKNVEKFITKDNKLKPVWRKELIDKKIDTTNLSDTRLGRDGFEISSLHKTH